MFHLFALQQNNKRSPPTSRTCLLSPNDLNIMHVLACFSLIKLFLYQEHQIAEWYENSDEGDKQHLQLLTYVSERRRLRLCSVRRVSFIKACADDAGSSQLFCGERRAYSSHPQFNDENVITSRCTLYEEGAYTSCTKPSCFSKQNKTKRNETKRVNHNIDLQFPGSPLDRCLPALANSNLIPRVKILVHEVISI